MILTILCWFIIVACLGIITFQIFDTIQLKRRQREFRRAIDSAELELRSSLATSVTPADKRRIEEAVDKAFERVLKPHFDELSVMTKELKDTYAWNDFVFNKLKEYEKDPTPETLERVRAEIRTAKELNERPNQS